jgi:signal transduction histidine kinase
MATAPATISAADVTQDLITRYLVEDHDRIALRMNDVVIRRIFSAGLDLQLALSLVGDQRGAREICHALDELDHAIRDIRDIVFDLGPPAR